MKRPILLVAVMTITLLAIATCPVLADGGGHLWFYSQDPGTLNPPYLLPNPQDYDPNYISSSPDPWLDESVVLAGDWETPFSIWLGCAQFESLGTKLVISVNDAANTAIAGITVEGTPVGAWDTNETNFPLAPHGVSNSAEWYGFAEADLGNLYSPPDTPYKIEININITLNPGADLSEAKIHFDAYGFTDEGSPIFSPYSHDGTFVIPELGVILLMIASFSAFALYSVKRGKASSLK